MKKNLTLNFSIDYIGQVVGIVVVKFIIYTHADGTFRTIDINEVLFKDKDITDFVSAMHPDLWDEWLEVGETQWKENNQDDSAFPEDNYSDHERPSTIF